MRNDDANPRADLAESIRQKMDNCNVVVDYLLDVLRQNLDSVKRGQQLDAVPVW